MINKCQHGQKITAFCATDSCQNKEAGGCDLCIRKYHSHLSHCLYLTEEEVHTLMRKFTVDNTIKPKCRLLQQSIYNYFTQIKTELSNSLDSACKNMINQIGYPYLFATNTLSTFKRLKNKQYKKISQKEFKHFYEVATKIEDRDLMKQENKIYQAEMKNTSELLIQLEAIIKNYEAVIKLYHNTFAHQPLSFQKISQVMKSVGSESPSKLSKKGTQGKEKQSAQYKLNKDIPKINIINNTISNIETLSTKGDSKAQPKEKGDAEKPSKIDKTGDIDHQTLSPSVLLPPKIQKTRDVSLDRKMVSKELKFNQTQQQKLKDPQRSESKVPHQRIEHLKQELNYKEFEINQKKKMLMDIMKPNEKSQRPLEKLQSMVSSPVKTKLSQLQAHKKQHMKTEDKSANESKSSKSSENLQDFEQQSSKIAQNTKNYAFAKLPIIQDTVSTISKRQQIQEVKKKLIIIPTDTNAKGLNDNKTSQIDSPLYKKRRTQNINQNKNKEEIKQKIDSSFPKKTEGDSKIKQVLQLRQNQQKSLALLMKSLTMNAQNAIIYLEASLKYADNNLSAAEYLSYLYLQLNRPKDCLTLCNKVLDKIQNAHESEGISVNIINNKAAALNKLGRYSEAILIIEKGLKYRQKDTLYKNLGDSYFSIGIYQNAIYNYQKSLKLNSNNDECHYNLAVCLYIQQNYINSKLSITRALQIQPNQEAYVELGSKIDEKILSI